MAFPRDDIDKVRERTDLAELAAEVTKVKKTGRSVMAVCPFHGEKTPSLSIDSARGLYHCFGCGKSGDVYTWVQETNGVDFTGAVELLARRAGITLTESADDSRRRGRRESLVGAISDAVAFYTERLKSAPDAAAARSYLRARGYDGDVVDQFSIGYSPDTWETLTTHLKEKGHTDKSIEEAGLASVSRRNTLVDRFRGRLMFPIFDLRGDAVGFGARVLEGDGPKYLNSPETPIYHKSRLLYGLNWAKSDIVRKDESVVVEGYTDVIAFHLAGRPVAVATCGTALGDEHLALLKRFSARIVLAFDGDAAGVGAALRGFDKALPGDLDLRVGLFPPGRDPADLVASGETEALEAAVGNSVPLLQFRIEQDLAGFDLSEPEARGRAAASVAKLIALHPDPVVRLEYVKKMAYQMRVEERLLERSTRGSVERPAPPERRDPERKLTGGEKAERELLRLLLANHSDLRDFPLDADMFGDPDTRLAFEAIAEPILALPPGETPHLGDLFTSMPADSHDLRRMLSALALEDRPLAAPADVVTRMRMERLDGQILEVGRRLEASDPASQAYSEDFQKLIALQRERRELKDRNE